VEDVMFVRQPDEVEFAKVDMDGAEKVWISVLLGEDQEVPNFLMRRFRIEPGGHTPYHAHGWEHEIFCVAGRGEVRQDGNAWLLTPGASALVPPDEDHNFVNTGSEPFEFLCLIPKSV
jgi:quercetin dioxygenase-like cupin family protein